MSITKSVRTKLSQLKPSNPNIEPISSKGIAKLGNPDISRIFAVAGRECEFFATTSVDTGLTGKSKGEVLAEGLMPFIPKFYSRSIGNESVRALPRDLMLRMLQTYTDGYKDKTPVVIMNQKDKIGEVDSSVIVIGEHTIAFSRDQKRSANFEENGKMKERLTSVVMATSVFADSEERPAMLRSLRQKIAQSKEDQGVIFEGCSCMIASKNGIQESPLAIAATSLDYKIDQNGEVFIAQDGYECNVNQKGQIIPGTKREISVSEDNVPAELITTVDDKNVIKTGCAVQIGRDGSEYLSGSDDVLLTAISQFKCQARFIKPEPVGVDTQSSTVDTTTTVQE